MNWLKSKRAWSAILTSLILPFAVSQGWITEVMAASIAALVSSVIIGDTLRPSGTSGAMGANGTSVK